MMRVLADAPMFVPGVKFLGSLTEFQTKTSDLIPPKTDESQPRATGTNAS